MTRSFTLVLVFGFLLLGSHLFAQVGQVEIPSPSPRLEFEDDFYDFGQVEMGTVVRHDYHFRNTGQQDLIVYGAKGGCTCVTAELHADTLAPDSSGYVSLVFDTKNRVGQEANNIHLMTNTPQKVHRVGFKGEILWPQKKDAPPN